MGGRVIPASYEQRAGRRFVDRSPFMTLKAREVDAAGPARALLPRRDRAG